MALAERRLDYDRTEVNPFDTADENPHPFGRVPVLDHDAVRIFETAAITTYIDAAFPGDSWTPADLLARARVAQVIGIVDSYGYCPLVREVFDQAVFAPSVGEPIDRERIRKGLAASRPVLTELDKIAAEGRVLNGALTRADLHLAPMIAYFAACSEGAEMLADHAALNRWFTAIRNRPSFVSTEPGLPGQGA